MSAVELYLIRHAEADGDDADPALSTPGRGQAALLYLPWLDQTPADEQDVDAVALSPAVDELVDEALCRAERGPLVLISYAFVVGWFVRAALDAPVWRWLGLHPANTALTIVRYGRDRIGTLITFNDDGHFGPVVTRNRLANRCDRPAVIPATRHTCSRRTQLVRPLSRWITKEQGR